MHLTHVNDPMAAVHYCHSKWPVNLTEDIQSVAGQRMILWYGAMAPMTDSLAYLIDIISGNAMTCDSQSTLPDNIAEIEPTVAGNDTHLR